jgi:hypothetical protein
VRKLWTSAPKYKTSIGQDGLFGFTVTMHGRRDRVYWYRTIAQALHASRRFAKIGRFPRKKNVHAVLKRDILMSHQEELNGAHPAS